MQAAPGTLGVLDPASFAALVLVSSRVGGLVLVAPVFSAKTVPVRVRTMLVILLSLLLRPAVLGAAPAEGLAVTPVAVLGEVMAGLAIGLGAAVFVGAAELAGDLAAIHAGLSGAALLDPLNRTSIPALGQLTQLLAVAVLLATDGHLLMLRALGESLTALPPGSPMDLRGGAGAMVGLGSGLFAAGLRFAGPVVAAVLVANTALALLGRAAPQLNVLSVAFPVQIAVGLFALAAALPFLAPAFSAWGDGYAEMLGTVFAALSGGGR
ncbi:flagellar biosynthetic protein FliR [Longimicrobium sp.]|uniref:flagellar biosynthetic protein FliR n=1 Tax=Longimicrobium sp. TaxID=2029185 RepID=UPI002E2EB2A7|nr:flagellar biosynthetic protein FliR [Longimicrobium sp.]HEX6038397.1 flagellar biosynthetic protein FliR [Longimicrobium sp.]